MEFHQNGKWTITQLPEGGWQLEEQIRHEDQIGAIILSSNLKHEDLVALQTVVQSTLGYEQCPKCEIAHITGQHTPTYEKWLRSLAEYDNLLKRNKVDLLQTQFEVSKKYLTELLIVVDNITAVLNARTLRQTDLLDIELRGEILSPEEYRILQTSLETILQKSEVTPIFPDMKPLSEYNPDQHQAIEMIEDDVKTTTIVPLMQGYLWRDKVLRTAQVRILQPRKKTVEGHTAEGEASYD